MKMCEIGFRVGESSGILVTPFDSIRLALPPSYHSVGRGRHSSTNERSLITSCPLITPTQLIDELGGKMLIMFVGNPALLTYSHRYPTGNPALLGLIPPLFGLRPHSPPSGGKKQQQKINAYPQKNSEYKGWESAPYPSRNHPQQDR